MKEMDTIKDAFFSALINKDFEELDQIMVDDAWLSLRDVHIANCGMEYERILKCM